MGFFYIPAAVCLAVSACYAYRWIRLHGMDPRQGIHPKKQINLDYRMMLLWAAISFVLMMIAGLS